MGFGAAQVLSGATKLSELGIDVSKNWLSYLLKNIGTPVDADDAATKDYVDSAMIGYLPLGGGIMDGIIDMNSHKIINLSAPVNPSDAARLADCAAGGVITWLDAWQEALYLIGQSALIDWTDLDLSALVGAGAKVAILSLNITAEIDIAGYAALRVRPKGNTDSNQPKVQMSQYNGQVANGFVDGFVLCPMDANKFIQYYLSFVGEPNSVAIEIGVYGYIT